MSSVDVWAGDLMKRKSTGDFLYKVISNKYSAARGENTKALCLAIDAEWGMGKTFFIERWSREIEDLGHAVVRFDAWRNDLSDDPLIGFMAALKNSLEPWIKSLPIAQNAKRELLAKTKAIVKSGSRAVIPLLMSAGTDIAKRYFSEHTAEIIEDIGIGSDELNHSDDENNTKPKKLFSDKALEKFFDDALKQHTSRQQAITKLKEDVGALAIYLDHVSATPLPIFVYIDELDRCRPDYAIRLLEGIKHLFDSPGMCFVISTNLTQLSESVKSIYGAGFNGHLYLKRFFDLDFSLPAPDDIAHAYYLMKGSVFSEQPVADGLNTARLNGNSTDKTTVWATNFAAIATMFQLDMRSQKQIFLQAESALAALDAENHTIHSLFLFGLAALSHKYPRYMDKVLGNRPFTPSTDLSGELANPIQIHHYFGRDGSATQEASLIHGLDHYFSIFGGSVTALRQKAGRDNNTYPDILTDAIANGNIDKNHALIRRYPQAVRLAGNFKAT